MDGHENTEIIKIIESYSLIRSGIKPPLLYVNPLAYMAHLTLYIPIWLYRPIGLY